MVAVTLPSLATGLGRVIVSWPSGLDQAEAGSALPSIAIPCGPRLVSRSITSLASGAVAVKESVATPFNRRVRSEEHTSELQSLMRTSYAVFCLQKQMRTPQTHSDFHRNYLEAAILEPNAHH